MKPFWNYFGGKFRSAPHYPAPAHGHIVEPFAGAAGYALRYPHLRITLVERYPVIAGIWRYLTNVSDLEVRRIPLVEHVDDLPSWVPQEARDLVGFNLNAAVTAPRRHLSAGNRRLQEMGRKLAGWTAERRDRVASQVAGIAHWTIIEGDYTAAPDVTATWFVDPPYQGQGKQYVHGSAAIDYGTLGEWCASRRGQLIACENDGASWLPFVPLKTVKGMRKDSAEVICHRGQP